MKTYKRWYCLIVIIILVAGTTGFAAKVTEFRDPILISAAKKLPNKGILQQDSSGFVYLKVSQAYVDKLIQLIDVPDLKKSKLKYGAHISVIDKKYFLGTVLPEVGKEYEFKIVKANKVVNRHCVKDQYGIKIWYVLVVDSPSLKEIRALYGSSAIKKWDFHISIGYQQVIYPDKACYPRSYERVE